jgi:UrcA family protein
VVVTAPSPLPSGAELRSKIVKISDLDLGRPEGRETLLGRIRSAAFEVCTPRASHPANFKDVDDYNRCIGEAMDRAIARVDSPELALVYARVR